MVSGMGGMEKLMLALGVAAAVSTFAVVAPYAFAESSASQGDGTVAGGRYGGG